RELLPGALDLLRHLPDLGHQLAARPIHLGQRVAIGLDPILEALHLRPHPREARLVLLQLLVDPADFPVDRGQLFEEGDLLADAHVLFCSLLGSERRRRRGPTWVRTRNNPVMSRALSPIELWARDLGVLWDAARAQRSP